MRNRAKDGTIYWVDTTIVPFLDREGKPIKYLAIRSAITDRKKAEDQLRIKIKELEMVNKELESFNYVSSHDLQEPLRQITNFVAVLLKTENNNLTEEGHHYLGRLSAISQQMRKLFEDLLAYSRMKNAVRNFARTELKTILDAAIIDLNDSIKEKGAKIKLDVNCTIRVVRFQIQQLFVNLLSNSIKFSHGERLLEIDIKSKTARGDELNQPLLDAKQRYCHITFSDNGIGFAPQHSNRIFEIFERLHQKDKVEGTGIGLAICHRIVENHKGVITASGMLGEGARFDIYLPYEEP